MPADEQRTIADVAPPAPSRGAQEGERGITATDRRRQIGHAATRLILGFLALVLVGWGAGELWLAVVGSAELDAVHEVVAHRSDTLTVIARTATWAGSAFLLVPLALISCLVLVRARLPREALAIALSLGGAMLLSDVVKLLVSRPRPPIEHLQTVAGSSFPSGHAAQASAFWLSLVLVVPRAGGSRTATGVAASAALVLVLAVATSRVYLGVHYPVDVVAGVLLGTCWAAFVWHSLQRSSVDDSARQRLPGR